MGFLVEDETTALMWRGLILTKAVEQFLKDVKWGSLDYLLIDMPPGTGDIQMGLARLLPQTEMLVVTTPARAAQKVAARVADMARRSYLKVVGVVENMSEFVAPNGERYALFGEGGGDALARRDRCAARRPHPARTRGVARRRRRPARGAGRARESRGIGIPCARGPDRGRAAAAGGDGRLHGAHLRDGREPRGREARLHEGPTSTKPALRQAADQTDFADAPLTLPAFLSFTRCAYTCQLAASISSGGRSSPV